MSVVVEYHEHHMVALGESRRGIVRQCDHVNLDGSLCGYADIPPNGLGPNTAGCHTTSRDAVMAHMTASLRAAVHEVGS